jgi:hypothetical protein
LLEFDDERALLEDSPPVYIAEKSNIDFDAVEAFAKRKASEFYLSNLRLIINTHFDPGWAYELEVE